MVFRKLVQFFINANAERLISQLADSYLMRRAAQMTASLFFRTKAIAEEKKIIDMVDKQRLQRIFDRIKKNFGEEIEKAKKELEGKK